MCTLCVTAARQLLPDEEEHGFYFAVATVDEGPGEGLIKAGDFMLGFINCPVWVWDFAPMPEPTATLGDDRRAKWSTLVREFDEVLRHTPARPNEVWDLVQACVRKGYDPTSDGNVAYWLFDYLGKFTEDFNGHD